MRESYELVSDEELICRLRDGEHPITDYIMDKYKYIVRNQAKSMYILGADREDLIQEGMIGLFKAIRDYDPGRDASFSTFAQLCISRQMYTAIEAARRLKHTPLNFYISLNKSSDAETGEELDLEQILYEKAERSPEELLIDKENLDHLNEYIDQELSGFEKQVFDLYVTGMSYSEIAKVLGKDEKSTDNALQRLKAKIKRFLRGNQ